jgi:hypothetical protein
MQVFTGPHKCILLVHIATEMKLGLITKSYAFSYCWIALKKKNILVTMEVNSPGFISLTKGLLHLNFVRRQFHIFLNYPVCWYCSQADLSRKIFYRFLGFCDEAAWHSQCFPVFWPFLFQIILPLVSNFSINYTQLGAFLCSSVTHNSHWIMITAVVWRKLFTWRSLGISSWLLLLHVVTRSQKYWTQRNQT